MSYCMPALSNNHNTRSYNFQTLQIERAPIWLLSKVLVKREHTMVRSWLPYPISHHANNPLTPMATTRLRPTHRHHPRPLEHKDHRSAPRWLQKDPQSRRRTRREHRHPNRARQLRTALRRAAHVHSVANPSLVVRRQHAPRHGLRPPLLFHHRLDGRPEIEQ